MPMDYMHGSQTYRSDRRDTLRYIKRIKLGPDRPHVERKFNERDRPTVRKLSDGQADQVDKALRSGRIEATVWTNLPSAEFEPVERLSVASRVARRLRKTLHMGSD